MNQEEHNGINITGENARQLEQIGNELSGVMTAKTETAAFDLCGEYKKIKPILEKALPFIELIPKFGKQVAAAIRLLMGIADQFCPNG